MRIWDWRLAILLAAAVAGFVPITGAIALDDGLTYRVPPSQVHLQRILKDEKAITQTAADAAILKQASDAPDLLTRLAVEFAAKNADLRYRQAVRAQQADLLEIARDPDMAADIVALAPEPLSSQIRDTIDAWYAIWRLAGIDEYDKVRIHPRPLGSALPQDQLLAIYQDAGARYQVDWAVLASINFIESDFGRVNGPSTAGAVGPMQFMPATWEQYGDGDINDPHDAIWAAARYLFLHGSRTDIGRALFAYNHDWDYVTAIVDYAAVMRRDPSWAARYYYWTTSG